MLRVTPYGSCKPTSLWLQYEPTCCGIRRQFCTRWMSDRQNNVPSNCSPLFQAGTGSGTAQQPLAQQEFPADAASMTLMLGVSDSTASFELVSPNEQHAHKSVYGTLSAAAQQGALELHAAAGVKSPDPALLKPLAPTNWPTQPGQPAYALCASSLVALDVDAAGTTAAAAFHQLQHHPENAHRLLPDGSLDSTCSRSAAFLYAVNVNSEFPATCTPLSPPTASPPLPAATAAVHLARQELTCSPALRLVQPTAVFPACRGTQPLDTVPCSPVSPSSASSSTSLQSKDLCSACAALVQEGKACTAQSARLTRWTFSPEASWPHSCIRQCTTASTQQTTSSAC